MSKHLSLEELECFDSHPSTRGKNHRYCCPLCGHDKPIDKNHQTLSLDSVSGAWHCFRCHAKGLLIEHHTKKADKKRTPYRMTGSVTPKTAVKTTVTPVKTPVDPEELAKFDQLLTRCIPIKGTPAEAYLKGRGITMIPEQLVYHPNPLGLGSSVGFPLIGKDKVPAGHSFRTIEGKGKPPKTKKNPRYQASGQVFVTLNALNAPRVVIVEAPIDALSLATCGIPAIATIGTSFPDWLAGALGPNKVIFMGHDNDTSGELGSKAAAEKLRKLGVTPTRLRPPKGCKDWNDALQELGTERLARALSGCFPLESPLPSPNRGNELEATEDDTPLAKRNVGLNIREYTEDMGVITLEYSEDVIIAGKVRKNLTWLRPDLIGIYENEDRIEAQRQELRTHARETQKQP
jgi:hypothetical protein